MTKEKRITTHVRVPTYIHQQLKAESKLKKQTISRMLEDILVDSLGHLSPQENIQRMNELVANQITQQ
jgi:hypothetical protein